jgi:hypothetical protein
MHSAIRKSLVLVLGAVAAITLGIPASAQAATARPDLYASNCATGPSPQDFQLVDDSGGVGEIDSTTSDLYFGGGTPHDFCQALVSSGIVQIFTTSTNYCLAYSAAADNAYQHVPTGCTSASPPTYMQWKFLYQTTLAGTKYYYLQNQYNGECIRNIPGGNQVSFTSCSLTGLVEPDFFSLKAI